VPGLKKIVINNLPDESEAAVFPGSRFGKQFFEFCSCHRDSILALGNPHQRGGLVTRVSRDYRLVLSMGKFVKINRWKGVQFTQEQISANLSDMSWGLSEIFKYEWHVSGKRDLWCGRETQRMEPRQIDHERGENRHGSNYRSVGALLRSICRLFRDAASNLRFPDKMSRCPPQQDVRDGENQGKPGNRIPFARFLVSASYG